MSVEIKLTQGYVAIVDDEDAHLAKKRWHAIVAPKTVYAARNDYSSGRRRTVFIHQEVIRYAKGRMPDHKDGNGLDNRRSNLRVATKQLNSANSGSRGGSSNYKGVFRGKGSKRRPWQAQIQIDGKRTHLGCFAWEEDAALAYNFAAYEAFGEFARLNT